MKNISFVLILLVTDEKERIKDKAIASCMYNSWIWGKKKTGEISLCLAGIFRLVTHCTRMMRHREERASEREQREKRKDEGKEGVKRGDMEEGSKDKAETCALLHNGKWRRGT